MERILLLFGLICALFILFAAPSSQGARGSNLRLGFTLFPYDVTEEAKRKVRDLAFTHSNTVLFHEDSGIPWAEAFEDAPFPPGVEAKWRQDRAAVPGGHMVVLAITPTGMSRLNLAPNLTGPEATGPLYPELAGKPFNDPYIKQAFLNYARRHVRITRPAFLVLGIEITELARHPGGKWPAFIELYRHVSQALKKEYPDLRIGTEHIVQYLMDPKIAKTAKPFLRELDFLALSFYPYAKEIPVLMGFPAFPAPPEEWRSPLQWIRAYAGPDLPLAVHETGYGSQITEMNVSPDPAHPSRIQLPGTPELQKQFMQDLLAWAQRENCPYLINFVPIDYPELMRKIPAWPEAGKIWLYTGLWDAALKPKPALAVWDRVLNAPQ